MVRDVDYKLAKIRSGEKLKNKKGTWECSTTKKWIHWIGNWEIAIGIWLNGGDEQGMEDNENNEHKSRLKARNEDRSQWPREWGKRSKKYPGA